MEYSIQELSRLSGVTTRTLRWYDEIGLLKPCRVAESGYRYYGTAEVGRLQEILFYRALGVELSQIRTCLDDPAHDRLETLRSHLTALEEEKQRLEGVIHSLRETIWTEERKKTMSDEKKFEAFKRRVVEENEASFGKEAREKYGDKDVDAAAAAVMHLTKEQYQEWAELDEEIRKRLGEAVGAGLAPETEEGKVIAALHKRWLGFAGGAYSVQRHRGIAELYVLDERFTAYYDREVSGCARFLRDAIHCWIQ